MADAHSTVPTRALARRDLLVKGGMAAAATAAATGAAAVVGAGPASAAPLAPVLLPIGPIRIYDSREAGGRLAAGSTRILVGDPIPDDFAYLLNVTITDTLASGFLSIYSADISWPGTSTINWSQPGQIIANSAYTMIRAADRGIAVTVGGPGGSTQFVLDITGVLTLVDLASATALGGSSPSSAEPARQLREAR